MILHKVNRHGKLMLVGLFLMLSEMNKSGKSPSKNHRLLKKKKSHFRRMSLKRSLSSILAEFSAN